MGTLMDLVSPPQPEAAKYGLLSLGDPVSTGGERWQGGYTYRSLLCSADVSLGDMCDSSLRVQVSNAAESCEETIVSSRPVIVQIEDVTTTFGFAPTERENRALQAMEMCTQKALEYELWTGALSTLAEHGNRHLASPDAIDVTPGATPIKIKYGLALLEQALANAGCGVRGVIHATRAVASVLGGKDEDGKLVTGLGNYIVAGTGYPGTSPTGVVPGTGVWMYATGPVTYRLDEPFVPAGALRERVIRENNTIATRAFRTVSAEFDGCAHFAVLVDLSLDYA